MRSSDNEMILCGFVADGSIKQTNGGGWLHRVGGQEPIQRKSNLRQAVRAKACVDWEYQIHAARATKQEPHISDLAESLGLSVANLRRLDATWNYDHWFFPMRDERRKIIGIRTRHANGDKRAVRGSTNGLFWPNELSGVGPLFFCEGPTDCCAILDLGFDAIGFASATAGHSYCAVPASFRDCVLFKDNDAGGKIAEANLIPIIRRTAKSVRVIAPPNTFKDVRAWRQAGAKTADVLDLLG